MSPCHQVKLSSCQAHFQFYQVVNFINCHLVKSEKTLYNFCLGVAIAMGLKTIQSYLIARALSAGLQFAKPNSLSEWNSMIPRISIKSTKQSAHQMRKRAIRIILKMTSGFLTPATIRFDIALCQKKSLSLIGIFKWSWIANGRCIVCNNGAENCAGSSRYYSNNPIIEQFWLNALYRSCQGGLKRTFRTKKVI